MHEVLVPLVNAPAGRIGGGREGHPPLFGPQVSQRVSYITGLEVGAHDLSQGVEGNA